MHFSPEKKVSEGPIPTPFPKKNISRSDKVFLKKKVLKGLTLLLKRSYKNTKPFLKLQIHVISKISKNFIDK